MKQFLGQAESVELTYAGSTTEKYYCSRCPVNTYYSGGGSAPTLDDIDSGNLSENLPCTSCSDVCSVGDNEATACGDLTDGTAQRRCAPCTTCASSQEQVRVCHVLDDTTAT